MPCEYFGDCEFFKHRLTAFPAVVKLYQTSYCQSEFNACARYKVARKLGQYGVPDCLFPNDMTGAERILNDRSSHR